MLEDGPAKPAVVDRFQWYHRWRLAIVVFAVVETALSASLVFGFVSFAEIFKDSLTSEQLGRLWTLGMSFNLVAPMFSGLVLDVWGPRVCAVVSSSIVLAGMLVLAAAAPDMVASTVGMVLVALGGPGVQLANFHFSNLFENRSTVMLLISAGFQVGMEVLSVFQVVVDHTACSFGTVAFAYSGVLAVLLLVSALIQPGELIPLDAKVVSSLDLCEPWAFVSREDFHEDLNGQQFCLLQVVPTHFEHDGDDAEVVRYSNMTLAEYIRLNFSFLLAGDGDDNSADSPPATPLASSYQPPQSLWPDSTPAQPARPRSWNIAATSSQATKRPPPPSRGAQSPTSPACPGSRNCMPLRAAREREREQEREPRGKPSTPKLAGSLVSSPPMCQMLLMGSHEDSFRVDGERPPDFECVADQIHDIFDTRATTTATMGSSVSATNSDDRTVSPCIATPQPQRVRLQSHTSDSSIIPKKKRRTTSAQRRRRWKYFVCSFVCMTVWIAVTSYIINFYQGTSLDQLGEVPARLMQSLLPVGVVLIPPFGWFLAKYGFVAAMSAVWVLGVLFAATATWGTQVPAVQIVCFVAYSAWRTLFYAVLFPLIAHEYGYKYLGALSGLIFLVCGLVFLTNFFVSAAGRAGHWFMINLSMLVLQCASLLYVFYLWRSSAPATPPPPKWETERGVGKHDSPQSSVRTPLSGPTHACSNT